MLLNSKAAVGRASKGRGEEREVEMGKRKGLPIIKEGRIRRSGLVKSIALVGRQKQEDRCGNFGGSLLLKVETQSRLSHILYVQLPNSESK